MTQRIAGIDVHKRMLAVVIADVGVEGEFQFERRKVGTSPSELCRLADWLAAEQVEEVVMESTAQSWKPVWEALERYWKPICQKRKGQDGSRERCNWRRRSPIADGRDARGISPMPNVW